MDSEEDFCSESYYPDESVTKLYELTESSLYFARFAYLKPYNKQLVCLGFPIKLQISVWKFCSIGLAPVKLSCVFIK